MRRQRRVKKQSNKLVGFAIIMVVVTLVIFFGTRSKDIKAKNLEDSKKIEQLQGQLEEQEQREQELEEYSKYVNTKQFIEKMAREKLGLVYPDELIFTGEN